jgi:hypothetical protein
MALLRALTLSALGLMLAGGLLAGGASASALACAGPAACSAAQNYPYCNVVGIYLAPPYIDTHIDCLFPLPIPDVTGLVDCLLGPHPYYCLQPE